jgi:DNA-binding FadR family transcriptional regulator
MDFRKIETKKLYIQIAEQIMERVRDGRLPPGSKLPSDRELAAQMGVSRPSIREALIALELLGVVEMRVGQGTFVVGKPISLEALRSSRLASPFDLLEARMVVESNVAVLVARKWQQGDIDKEAYKKAYEITEEMRRIVADDVRVEQFYRLGLGFHKALAEAGGNEVLAGVVSDLVDATGHPLWALINKKILQDRKARENQIKEHELVLSAIERSDGEAASRAMCHHLEELSDMALE